MRRRRLERITIKSNINCFLLFQIKMFFSVSNKVKLKHIKIMPVYMSIEQLGRSCNLTCFELILQLFAYFAFSICLVLKADFGMELENWDVYLPLLLGDFFHIYHSFNRYFRYILQPSYTHLPQSDVTLHRQKCQRGCAFTCLVSLAKYLFYIALDAPQNDPDQKIWRTVGMCCLFLGMFILVKRP